LKKRGAVIAAQASFERVILGEAYTFPLFPQMNHKKILKG
jgi:hypothetical protein